MLTYLFYFLGSPHFADLVEYVPQLTQVNVNGAVGWLKASCFFLAPCPAAAFYTLSTKYVALVLTQASYGQTVTQTPALGTVWIYSVVKMDLAWACISLALTVAYVKYMGLKLLF